MDGIAQGFLDPILTGGATLCLLAATVMFLWGGFSVLWEYYSDKSRTGRGLLTGLADIAFAPTIALAMGAILGAGAIALG